jgi:hypothetical protein
MARYPEVLKLTPDVVDEWVSMYETECSLPQQKVPCCAVDCTKLTVMFGDNLDKRVVKYGGIRKLLETFKCQVCRRKEKVSELASKLEKKGSGGLGELPPFKALKRITLAQAKQLLGEQGYEISD